MKQSSTDGSAGSMAKDRPVVSKSFLVSVLAVIIIDVFFLNMMAFSLLMILTLPVLFLRLLFAIRNRALLKRRLAGLVIVLLAVVTVLGLIRANTAIARDRAAGIIAACERYKAKHGQYPERLTDLVPDHLPQIPRANFTFTAKFHYVAYEDKHLLIFSLRIPFGRAMYDLEEKKWKYTD